MPSHLPPSTSVLALLAGQPVEHTTPDTGCRLLRITLQDGVDVLVWKGERRQHSQVCASILWGFPEYQQLPGCTLHHLVILIQRFHEQRHHAPIRFGGRRLDGLHLAEQA